MSDMEAATLALIAVEESDGDGALAIKTLHDSLPELDPDEKPVVERAIALILERTQR